MYYVLASIHDSFTHYDLHSRNVVLYKPVDGKYLEFHYHLSDGSIVTFKSQYISKMIDYGRSFIKTVSLDSAQYYSKLCKQPECNRRPDSCGYDSGHGWMTPPQREENHYICSSLNNRSHDLKLLDNLLRGMPWNDPHFNTNNMRGKLQNILEKVYYKQKYGTPPAVGKGDCVKIDDVVDAELCIRQLIQSDEQKLVNDEFYKTMTKLGDLHIYRGKPTTFTPSA